MILGTGVDIVEIERIADMRTRQGERFHDKVFTAGEVEYCLARKASDQHFAARFAAKEATMKALGTGWAEGVGFRSIEVLRGSDGPPRIQLHAKAAEHAQRLGVTRIHVSLSHGRDHAIAQVILEGE